jgi:hypothetical protein
MELPCHSGQRRQLINFVSEGDAFTLGTIPLAGSACPSKSTGIRPCSASQFPGSSSLPASTTVEVIAMAGNPQVARHSMSERVATLASLYVSK